MRKSPGAVNSVICLGTWAQYNCSAKSSNANGVPQRSPGLSRSGYPGSAVTKSLTTPTGLRPPIGGDAGGTPLGFDEVGGSLPRVGARSSRQPWALLRNAVGVGRVDGRGSATNAEPVASHEPPPARWIRHGLVFGHRSRGRRSSSAAVGERGRSTKP